MLVHRYLERLVSEPVSRDRARRQLRADVRRRRAAHPVPVREARPTTSSTGCARRARSSSSSRAGCYREGEPATCFYVLLDGTGDARRRVGERRRRGRPHRPARRLRAARSRPTWATGCRSSTTTRCGSPSRPGSSCSTRDKFAQLMRDWFPMAVHLLEGLFFGTQNTQQAVGQRERLLALGSLSAGLTHELNNPAAAAVRATVVAARAGRRHAPQAGADRRRRYDRATWRPCRAAGARRSSSVAKAPSLTPLEASDREDDVGDWLEEHDIADGWDLAPIFVAGRPGRRLARPGGARPSTTAILEGAVRWLNYTRRDRAADERDRGLHHPDLHAGRRGQAVLADGPGAVPGGRRPRAARQHAADAGRQDRRRHHRGQGLRPRAAADPGLRRPS